MDHILQQMQAFSQQCVEILSEIVGIDVSIIDNQQMRIAGSGRMKGRVGNIAAYGHIAQHALETRQTTVVLNPIVNPICQSCETRSTCDNLSELWTPIMLDHTPIGVIGCVCYSVSQRRQFIDRQDTYVRFFEEFASLLGNRAHALIEADRSNNIRFMLEHVLERVQVGTLILDTDNHIHDMNRQGRQILQLPADTQDFSQLHLRPICADDSKQYCILNGEHQINIIGDIYNLGLNPYDRLLLFSSSILILYWTLPILMRQRPLPISPAHVPGLKCLTCGFSGTVKHPPTLPPILSIRLKFLLIQRQKLWIA